LMSIVIADIVRMAAIRMTKVAEPGCGRFADEAGAGPDEAGAGMAGLFGLERRRLPRSRCR
jgi:hypothetical protein